MTFDRPWLLLVAWLPLAWAVWKWRASLRRGALLLKALSLTAILLALAEPKLTILASRVAVAILADTSASLAPQDLDRASQIAGRLEGSRGGNWTQVIPFARGTRRVDPAERDRTLKLRQTAGEAGRATNMEAAIREGLAQLPAGMVPRLVLISDGRENVGSAARAAWQARQLGIPIDTFALEGRPRPDLRLESVTLPTQAFTGEQFPIDLVVHAPRRTAAAVEIAAGGKVLGTRQVSLERGPNQLRVHARLTTAGAIDLAATIRAQNLGEVHIAQAIAIRRPRVLFLSRDPESAEAHLRKALEAGQFDIERAAIPEKLSDYQVLVFNNWDLEAVPPSKKTLVEEFVKQGGGLLVIGGENNVYVEKKAPEDAMERVLPAKLAPPRTPEGTCVVLILDKSSSMEGKKIELARIAAIGVIDNLRPIDQVGVLIFDNSFHWLVPVRKAEDRNTIKRIVAGIMPDGGTQIAPALQEAYRRIVPVRAVYKHIVLLTDGISEEGDSLAMARDAALNRVTISTVGLGQDVNRAFLEKVAVFARGKAYFMVDPSGLEQILLRDVMEHTGSTAIEKQIRPQVVKKAEVLDGVPMDSAPPLQGYVKFIPKPSADLLVNADQRDPLLVRWQYGLGRSAVFTSDAKSRWAARWVGWEGFDKLWANIFRDLLPHANPGEATVKYNSANDELVIDYKLSRDAEPPAAVPDIFVFGQEGFQRPVKVDKVAEGAWRGRVRVGQRQGLFRVRPLAETRAFPEVGFHLQEPELAEYGSNQHLLRLISEFTGGRGNPRPAEVFDSGGRYVASTMRLWPGLLALAVLLNVVELILRKWKGVTETLRAVRRAPRAAAGKLTGV